MSAGDSSDSLVGTTLDSRYRIEKVLGRGGMGTVYRARHLMLDQVVALKVLLPDLSTDSTATRRFVREARSTFRFDHPHCVKVSDFGATDEGVLYLVMDYLDGRTVDTELRVDGPMSGARTAHILAQTADALHYAHGLGLVHRDLKGENIMLIRRGGDFDFVKVLDFGLAKLWDEDGGGLSRIMSVAALTADGMTFGTPNYMSPEQARGDSLTPASDIFSLGVCGFEMVTGGTLPFEHDNPVQVLTQIIVEEVPTPSSRRPDLAIAPDLEALLMHCMAKDPARRPSSAADVRAELESLARSLSRGASAVPPPVAASETMELAPQDAEGTANLRSPAEPSRAQTDLPVTGPPTDTPPTDAPVTDHARASGDAPPAADLPPGQSTQAVIAAAGIGAHRRAWYLAATIVVAGAAAVVFLTTRGDDGDALRKKRTVAVDAAQAAAGTDAAPADASPPADAPAPDAGSIDAASAPDARPRQGGRKAPSPDQKRARALVIEARAAGSALARMSKADAALRLDPRNLEARYLFGAALLDSGQKQRGCAQLRRARRLRRARAAYSAAGCGSPGD